MTQREPSPPWLQCSPSVAMRPDQIANPASGPLSQYTPTTSNLQSTKDKIKKKKFFQGTTDQGA